MLQKVSEGSSEKILFSLHEHFRTESLEELFLRVGWWYLNAFMLRRARGIVEREEVLRGTENYVRRYTETARLPPHLIKAYHLLRSSRPKGVTKKGHAKELKKKREETYNRSFK